MLEYEYEAEMESIYQASLYKSFKKTIEDGFFDFIIVDAVNDKCSQFEPFWSFARLKGFEVSISKLKTSRYHPWSFVKKEKSVSDCPFLTSHREECWDGN